MDEKNHEPQISPRKESSHWNKLTGSKKTMGRMLGLVLAATLVAGGVLVVPRVLGGQDKKASVLTVSTLEEIIEISELSTFQAVYNGIAEVRNESKPEQIDYYVSYDAKVNAGFDFEQVEVYKDAEGKTITVKIPDITINDVNVDIGSLDYIFENRKANQSTISEEALKAAIRDAENESKQEPDIKKLAEENAKNIITALIKPFIEQEDAQYKLVIKFRGEK